MRLALRRPFLSPPARQVDPAQQPRLLADGSLVDAGARPGRAPLLLSRGLCRFRHIDLSLAPAAQRIAALGHQLTAWAPFDRPAFDVAPQGSSFQVYAWDADVVTSALRTTGWPPDTVAHCETAFRPAPDRDGARLLVCIDGYEGQRWRDGSLQHSRWWPVQPDDAQWALFLRAGPQGNGAADPTAVCPAPTPLPWLARPSFDFRAADELASGTSKWERVIVAAVGLGLLAFTGAQAHLAIDAYRAQQRAQDDLSALQQSTGPVLRARDRALAQTAVARKLADAVTGVLPIELLGHLDEVLPRKGVVLQDIDLNGQKLRLELALSPQVSRSEVIAALRQSAWLVDITEAKDTSTRGTVPFDMRLRGARAPARTLLRPGAAASAPVVGRN
jgi:hypothetical protein